MTGLQELEVVQPGYMVEEPLDNAVPSDIAHPAEHIVGTSTAGRVVAGSTIASR